MLLLIHCILFLLSLYVGVCIGFLFYDAILSVLSSLAIIWLRERERERELVVLLEMCSCCRMNVFRPVSIPRGALGWSVIFDCDISWLYHLFFITIF